MIYKCKVCGFMSNSRSHYAIHRCSKPSSKSSSSSEYTEPFDLPVGDCSTIDFDGGGGDFGGGGASGSWD